LFKDGARRDKYRKSAGVGSVEDPFVTYSLLDGSLPDTAAGDLASIRESLDAAQEFATGQLVMDGTALPLAAVSTVTNNLVLVSNALSADIFVGDVDVTIETGLLLPAGREILLKNKDLADVYAIGSLGDVLTWMAY
jgi:hypothetical protein